MLRTIFILLAACLCENAAAQLSFLDPSFGNNGVVLKSVRDYAVPREMAKQPDGKLVLAGVSVLDGMVVRFLGNGQPDNTFGNNGVVLIPNPNGGSENYSDLVLMGDRIVTGGWEFTAGVDTNVVTVFKSDGSLDSSFGVNGFKKFRLDGTAYEQYITSIARVNDSQLVAAGIYYNHITDNLDIFVVKLDKQGNFVSSFGNNGQLFIDHQSQQELVHDITTDPAGNIYLAGYTGGAGPAGQFHHAMVIKIKPDGTLDPAFANQGKLIQDIVLPGSITSSLDEWYVMAWQQDNIILGGYSGLGFQREMIMQRIKTNGRIDSSFAHNSLMRASVCPQTYGEVSINKIIVTPDNKIMAGCTSNCGSDGNYRMLLAGYTSAGKTDSTFGINGYMTMPGLQNYDEKTTGLVLNPDGTICHAAVSMRDTGFYYDIAIVKYKKPTPAPTGIGTPHQTDAQIFPNLLAAGENITIQFKGSLTDQASGVLFDISGRQLLSFSIPRGSRHTQLNIPNHTAPGTYLLKLSLPGAVRTERITIR
jgi:uncharacterized delta-60 repeat protein